MNFLTREQYVSCFAAGQYPQFVGAFWHILFQVNPDWRDMTELVLKKREWLSLFRSIEGMPYNRAGGKQMDQEKVLEISTLMKSLSGVPERVKGTGYHPIVLLIYPFAVRQWEGKYRYPPSRHSRGRKKYETLTVYLNEAKRFVEICSLLQDEEASWLIDFDHNESRYQNLKELISKATSQLIRLQVLQHRADVRRPSKV